MEFRRLLFRSIARVRQTAALQRRFYFLTLEGAACRRESPRRVGRNKIALGSDVIACAAKLRHWNLTVHDRPRRLGKRRANGYDGGGRNCAHHQHLATRRRGEACFFRLLALLLCLITSANHRSYHSEERRVGTE